MNWARPAFEKYMRWYRPLVRWSLNHSDWFTRSHPRALGYLAERLFICWYLLRHKRLFSLGPVARLPCAPVPGRIDAPETASLQR
jgi:hypothetical protein